MNGTVKDYLKISYVDWLGPFSNLWIGFNCWYKTISRNATDLEGALKIASNVKAQNAFSNDMQEINRISNYLVEQLRLLATVRTNDNNVSVRDTTTIEFRLRCMNSNPAIDFLYYASQHPLLKIHCKGIIFLNPGNDPVFANLHQKYHALMASEHYITNAFNAEEISQFLYGMGITHYGRLLIHDLNTKVPSKICNLNEIFGAGFTGLLGQIQNISKTQLRKKLKNINESVLWSCKLVEGGDPFKRYLLVLYKFRSAYFHGSMSPTDPLTQVIAKNAYLSLRSIMERSV